MFVNKILWRTSARWRQSMRKLQNSAETWRMSSIKDLGTFNAATSSSSVSSSSSDLSSSHRRRSILPGFDDSPPSSTPRDSPLKDGNNLHRQHHHRHHAPSPQRWFNDGLKVVSVISWSLAYIIIILTGRREEICLIHRAILAHDLVWELSKSLVWTKSFTMQLWVAIGWLGLDLEITRIFWVYGDTPSNPAMPYYHLSQQRLEFIGWFIFFALCSVVISFLGEAFARVWRHSAEIVSLLIQLHIVRITVEYGVQVRYHALLAWSMMIGNACCLLSIRKYYVDWFKFREHPIRFVLTVFCFVPTISFNILYILIAHEALEFR